MSFYPSLKMDISFLVLSKLFRFRYFDGYIVIIMFQYCSARNGGCIFMAWQRLLS